MGSGSRSGSEGSGGGLVVLSAFRDDEGGFTTIAVAVSIVLCLTLVFAAASAGWVSARSSEIQRVADSAALAGQNAVAAYSTVAQVTDACVLSMGLVGVISFGAGLVTSCVPGLAPLGVELCAAGGRILEARNRLARSAAAGLERLETVLPLLVVANSASCVAANGEEGLSYVGCALPVPATSGSDFSALLSEVGDEGLDELSGRMRQASEDAREARARLDEALERGWEADCGSEPHSLWERASSLAGLAQSQNPRYASPDGWTFGAALVRARAYYEARLAAARVEGATAEELTDAACRRAFYGYALERARAGSWEELADGTVRSDLPRLPRNAGETRETELYTQVSWPCTTEGGVRTLHCSDDCPGATGPSAGRASLSQLDSGSVGSCGQCHMDVVDLGRVASASTSVDNGFEYHWRIVVEASEDHERARADLVEAEERLRALAEEGEGAFSDALDQLTGDRATLCPPGAWGCVAVVARADGTTVPTELTEAFLTSAQLPAGAAVSAAVLAPDGSDSAGTVLSGLLDGLEPNGTALGAADSLLGLWGDLLAGYGSAADGTAEAGREFLDGVGGVPGGSVASWLRDRLVDALGDAGLEPVDVRPRKPVLVNTQDVLDKAGVDQAQTVRDLVSRLPDSPSPSDLARLAGAELTREAGGTTLAVTEILVPGTDASIPLTVDLAPVAGAT